MVCGRLPLVLLLLGLSQVLVHAHFFSVRHPRKHGFGISSSWPRPWRTPTMSFRRRGHSHESSESSESGERPTRFQFGFVHRHRPGSGDSLWQRLAERGRRKLEWLRRRKPFGVVRPFQRPSFPWHDSGIRREWASSWRGAKERVKEALCALFGRHCPPQRRPPHRRRPARPNTTPCPRLVTSPTSTPDPTTPPITLPTLTSTSPGEAPEVNNNEQGSGGISEIEVRGITERALKPVGELRATSQPEVLLSTSFRKPPGRSTGSTEREEKENESGVGGRGTVDALPHAGTTERLGKENEGGGPTTRSKVDTRPTTTTTTTTKPTTTKPTTTKPTTTEEYYEIPDIIY